MQAPTLEFWYDFASTYSYLSAMRIEAQAKQADITIAWKPFLLGPIFQAQGWHTSPFNIYPAKGRYMVRDLQRLAVERGLPFQIPKPFPQHSLAAARMALATDEGGCIAPFSRAIYHAEFADGLDIGLAATLTTVLEQLASTVGLDPARIAARSIDPAIKDRLKTQSAEAVALGVFGSPSFRTPDGELFWGDDRLDQAIAWVRAPNCAVP